MAKLIRVHSRFEFRKDYRSSKIFNVGLHEVSDEDANHWFVRGNSEIVKDIPNEVVVDQPKKKPHYKKNATEIEAPAEENVANKTAEKVDVKPGEPVDDSYIGQIKKMVGY